MVNRPRARKYLMTSLSLATGAVFLFSAWTKLEALELTEYALVDYGHIPWLVAGVAARLLTGVEAVLGLLLVLHVLGHRNWVPLCGLAMVALFSIYIGYLWANFGNRVNCGCFGDTLLVNPALGLAKNGVIAVTLWAVYKWGSAVRFRGMVAVSMLAGIALITVPFVTDPLQVRAPRMAQTGMPFAEMPRLYDPQNLVVPATDLSHGQVILAFLSPGCPHCRMAAYKMHLLRLQHPQFPFHLVIGGTRSDLSDFWEETKAKDVPWSRLEGRDFISITHGVFPTLLFLNEGRIVGRPEYNRIDADDILRWLQAPVAQEQPDNRGNL